uniref:Uncharacterized protein n=1 Tax=Mycena chlorophos TaxID=658473 RepID=A0ABQ0LFQ8_MYCCL|nr:predicted protein [Mycena chlorophos]
MDTFSPPICFLHLRYDGPSGMEDCVCVCGMVMDGADADEDAVTNIAERQQSASASTFAKPLPSTSASTPLATTTPAPRSSRPPRHQRRASAVYTVSSRILRASVPG